MQGPNESNSSVAFQVLIINCQTYIINFFSFNSLTSNFCFPKKYIFRRQKRMFVMDARLYFQIWNAPGKIICSLRSMNNFFLRYRNLFIKATKMQIPDKRYHTYTVCIFWDAWRASALRYLSLEHLDGLHRKICGIQVKL